MDLHELVSSGARRGEPVQQPSVRKNISGLQIIVLEAWKRAACIGHVRHANDCGGFAISVFSKLWFSVIMRFNTGKSLRIFKKSKCCAFSCQIHTCHGLADVKAKVLSFVLRQGMRSLVQIA